MTSCMRNPAVVRIVTMLLLTVSDIDVALSVLFMMNLRKKWVESEQSDDGLNIIYPVAFLLVIMGFFVYFVGIVWLGPQQRRQVMKYVINLMEQSGDDFITPKFKTFNGKLVSDTDSEFRNDDCLALKVTMNSAVYPKNNNQPNGRARKTFSELECTKANDRTTFQDGLSEWGVGAVWQAVQLNNERNCVDRAHGIPLYRTAQFGFMPQPSPKELGGIFNANALYSFSVGTFELGFGGMMLVIDGFTMMTVLPLAVSLLSFVLSLANVIFDFSAVLLQLEMEERMGQTIKSRINASQSTQRRRLVNEKDKDEAEIRRKYKGTQSEILLKKADELEKLNTAYATEIGSLDKQMFREMEMEITAWQRKLQQERDLLQGKSSTEKVTTEQFSDSLQRALDDKNMKQEFAKTMDAKIKEVEENARKKIDDLNTESENFQEELDHIITNKRRRVQILQQAMGSTNLPIPQNPASEPLISHRS